MTELLDIEHENAILASKKLQGVLKDEKDIGPEQIKLCLYAQVNFQRTLASFTQDRAVNLKAITFVAGKDREDVKKLIKKHNLEQKLLPDKK